MSFLISHARLGPFWLVMLAQVFFGWSCLFRSLLASGHAYSIPFWVAGHAYLGAFWLVMLAEVFFG